MTEREALPAPAWEEHQGENSSTCEQRDKPHSHRRPRGLGQYGQLPRETPNPCVHLEIPTGPLTPWQTPHHNLNFCKTLPNRLSRQAMI